MPNLPSTLAHIVSILADLQVETRVEGEGDSSARFLAGSEVAASLLYQSMATCSAKNCRSTAF
jgi:hypothetical protein